MRTLWNKLSDRSQAEVIALGIYAAYFSFILGLIVIRRYM